MGVSYKLAKEVLGITEKFEKAGKQIYIVGGAVRDILSGIDPTDWDFATDATPQQIQKLFPKSFYTNKFGTVGVNIAEVIYEITTFRIEGRYEDFRHPQEVTWGKTIEQDLGRRDFKINAMALRLRPEPSGSGLRSGQALELIDPLDGQTDLKNKIIRTVGDPDKRFGEDALRLLRAVRFAAELGFEIEKNTFSAISKNAHLLSKISGERIRDELFKIVLGKNAAGGFFLAKKNGLLSVFLPELDFCFEVEQKSPKRHHIFDVGTHCVMSLDKCPSKDPVVRLATLLHDIGKAKVADVTEEGVRTFYNHEVVGGALVKKIAERLHLSRAQKEKLYRLVRWHQFTVDEKQTDKALRRFIRNVGLENVEHMMDLRVGDRLGGGLQQPESWRLKLFRERLKEVLKKPFTVADLKVDGHDVMKILGISPGPKVGEVLKTLFEEVVEDSTKNNRDYLLEEIKKFKAV